MHIQNIVDTSHWRGAAPDRFSFYSTSSSIAQEDWLPVLRSRFQLHLDPKQSQKTHGAHNNSKVPELPKFKKESGYTKNTNPFVVYDKEEDEKEIK